MNVIELEPVTDATLLSSSVAEDDYPPWSAVVSYVVGQVVMRAVSGVHLNFEALTAGVDATPPEVSAKSDTPRWLNRGPTNRWAMFDDAIGTFTVDETEIDVSMVARGADSLLLMELVGRQAAVSRWLDGQVIYSATLDLDDTPIAGFYDWFFEPFRQRGAVLLKDLPGAVYGGSVQIQLTGTAGVACGVCRLGYARSIGLAEYGVDYGIEDYSTKSTDKFGRLTLQEGAYSQIVKLRAETPVQDFNPLSRRLAGLRATLAYFELTDRAELINVNVLGYYKDFRINLPGPMVLYTTLELESLAMTL
ncbi:hypothetical protein [Delftia sp. PS-11]|uniref:hypothetical protein n=1 Tax=Delftia sp. PS-11 TaxID=2767222 RepID=UPI0024573266|nr:hypothetical protein [Delftia sp. PS-11]KAJ8745430.1 hypothetical protein H9T68_06420 [Delftia sp. PS-11]